MSATVTLFRPVGPQELALIEQSGWTAFPPRLPEQPIFYPVLEEGYAEQIARDWNATDPACEHRGHVTRFAVRAGYIARFPVQCAGAAEHTEYWIPAEELATFNENIVGPIELVTTFVGPEPIERRRHVE